MKTRLVDIVVPTHGRPQLLARLITSLAPQLRLAPEARLIVVNDGTHGAPYDAVITEFGSLFDYVALDRSGGPANARNIGARRSEAPYVAFLDDDCEAPSHWLNWLLALIEVMPEVDVFGGPTRPPPPAAPGAVERFNRAFGLHPRPLFANGTLYCLPSANVALRRQSFEKMGGFDVGFRYAAGEDLNLFYRMARAGSEFYVDDQWYVFHPVADRVGAFLKRWYRYGYGTAQHVLKSGDPHDYGLGGSGSLLSILAELPRHVRHMKRRLEHGGSSREWLLPSTNWRWEPLHFTLLSSARHIAYKTGGAHAYAKEGGL